MRTLRLAVSAGSFLVLFTSPLCAQTQRPSPPAQAVSATEGSNLSDEERGRLFLIRKEYSEAQDLFTKLTKQYPQNAVYWNELGISFHSQSDLTDALKCYQKSAKLDKHYADAQNNIGTVYYARRKFPKAIRAYKHAIGVKDDAAAFYLNLGYAYFGEKQYDESITSFRKALQLDPEIFEPGKARSGTVIQDRSIATDRAHFYFLLAKSFAQSGNAERCAIYLKKARDEGYQDIKSVHGDPAFAKVIQDPAIQDVLEAKPLESTPQ